MSGRIGDLSDQQSQALKSLRLLISEGGPGTPSTQSTDVDLLRFLRARSFNVVAAFKQWKLCQDWRHEYDVETILDGPYPLDAELKSTLALAYHGEDQDHRPLYLERSGAVDPLVIAQLNPDMVVRRHIYHQELQVRRTEENAQLYGTPGLDNWCEIHDMRGLSIQHRQVLGLFTRVARIDTDFYPERAGRIFFINVPAVFPALWKICRRALDVKTREKFVVLSTNRTAELLDYFLPDQLPVEYGGTLENIFPVLALRRESRPLHGVKFLDAVVLARRRTMKSVRCNAGDVVTWYFRVTSKDVKFCVHWSASVDVVNTDNPVQVSRWLEGAAPVSEACVVSASSGGSSDCYFCAEDGVLGLVWENDSIFQSRNLSVQITVEKSSSYDSSDTDGKASVGTVDEVVGSEIDEHITQHTMAIKVSTLAMAEPVAQ